MIRALASIAVISAGALVIAGTAHPPGTGSRTAELKPALLRTEVAETLFKAQLPLLIDVYWLRTINAVGDIDSAEKNRLLYDYGRLITDLDPKFRYVYWFVAISVPYRTGRESWVNSELADDLLRRGLAQFPDDLNMQLLLAYNLMTYDKNYVEAGRVFQTASRLPRAPPYAALIATRLFAQGGNPDLALEVARSMRDSASDEHSREEFAVRVKELEVERVLQKVDDAIHQFQQQLQRDPESMEELQKEGFWSGPLKDPFGGKITIGYDKRSHSESQPRRIELYEDE